MKSLIAGRVVTLGAAALLGVATIGCAGTVEVEDEPVAGGPSQSANSTCMLPGGARSFAEQATDAEHIDGSCVPAYSSADLQDAFIMIRDSRPLTVVEQPNFPRRIPWLAVDNGCEERAPAAAYLLAQASFTVPYYARVKSRKGQSLGLATENDPAGNVQWNHHVAPVVRVANELMVLDPAIDPGAPLRIADWISRFNRGQQVDVALCRDAPVGDGCFAAAPVAPLAPPVPAGPDDTIYMRLQTEWRVQEILGRDPNRVLGDCPPWLSCAAPEPLADPTQPPRIRRFASDQFVADVYSPVVYIIGDNFVPGLTTVRFQGNGIDELVPIEKINRLRILVIRGYPPGAYLVTAANGTLASNVAILNLQLRASGSRRRVHRDGHSAAVLRRARVARYTFRPSGVPIVSSGESRLPNAVDCPRDDPRDTATLQARPYRAFVQGVDHA